MIEKLQKALREDKGYFNAWQANIAMAFSDSYNSYKYINGKTYINSTDLHIISNNAAKYFLDQLIK